MKEPEKRLNELLSQGSLGGPDYDDILERVMDRVAASKPPRTRRGFVWVLVSGAALVPMAALWLVFGQRAGNDFTAKGPATIGAAAIDIGCGASAERSCRIGDTLMFTVNAAIVSGHLGAYAERADDPTHTRIWYFGAPSAGASSGGGPVIASGAGTVVVPQGVQIGPEHRPGIYRVTAWIASRPLTRPELDDARDELVRSRSQFELRIVP